MTTPKISVVIATYNGQNFIREQIDSLLAQTLAPSEILVSDDASTDGTIDIINEYIAKYPDLFRLIYNQASHGPHDNFKYALRLAKYDLIAPCDQDDIWMPDKLLKLYEAMDESTLLTYCQEDMLTETTHARVSLNAKLPTLGDLIYGNIVRGHLQLFRKDVLKVFDIAPEITFDHGTALYAACLNAIKLVDYCGCIWRRHETVVTTAFSNHMPYAISHLGKWNKFLRTMIMLGKLHSYTGMQRSKPILLRMNSISAIFEHSVAYNSKLANYSSLASCLSKQTSSSYVKAGLLMVKFCANSSAFNLLNLKHKIGFCAYSFCYPSVWWFDYHSYDSL